MRPPAVRAWMLRLLGAALMLWAGFVLWREVRSLDWREVDVHVRAWGGLRIAAAAGLAGTSFTLVAVVEWLGLKWSGAPLPWRTAALRSFIVNGLIHSLGANVVTATLARSWVYRRLGIRLTTSAATTLFVTVSLIAGLAVLVGSSLLSAGPEQLEGIHAGTRVAKVGGGVLLGLAAAYLGVCAARPSARLFAGVRLPRATYAFAQVAIGAVDNLVSSALLWLLIGDPAPPYAAFAVAYVLAYLAGILSTVPGGAGVFEASMFVLLPHTSRGALAAGFLGFRLIFYLAPLIAALLLIMAELVRPAAARRTRRLRAQPVDAGQGRRDP